MKNRKLKKTLVLCFCSSLLLWTAFRFTLNKLCGVESEQTEFDTVKDTIETVGVIIRDEEVLDSSKFNPNNLKYLLSDGEKISKNDILAEVYSNSEEAKISYRIDEVNKEIEILEKLNFSKYNIFKGINFINGEINNEIKNLLTSLGDFQISESAKIKRNILYLLNEKQIILGKDVNLDDRLQKLRDEKNKLLSLSSKSISCINAPDSGDFMSHTDGYENVVDYKHLISSDLKNFDFENISSDNLQSNTLGKIIKSETWYAVCLVSSEDANRVKIGQEAKIDIPSSNFAFNIPCKVESVVKKSNSDDYIVIISCDYMNKELALLRKENFKINIGEYSGLKINKDAIHKYSDENGIFESGVYVKLSGYLKFKKVNPIFVNSSEVICSYSAEESTDDKYLQPGDFVVVKGMDLYENKKVV